MIKRIIKIKNCPSFVDFKPASDLPAFAKYNLIYGWNGTGKTSFSRILRSCESGINHFEHPERQSEFELELDGGRHVNQNGLTSFKNIRVFNKDFVEESVFGTGGPKPIFFLGTESKVDKERIDTLERELEKFNRRLVSKETALEKLQTKKSNRLSEKARFIKHALTTATQDHYRNYNRSDIEKSIRSYALELQSPKKLKLPDGRLSDLNKSIQQTSKATISPLTLPNLDLSEIEKQVTEALSKTVTSRVIEKLQSDQEVNKWVEQGLQIHKDKSLEVCAFCEQSIPAHRLDELDKHFSDEYQKMIQTVRSLKDRSESRRIKVDFPESSNFYDEFVTEYLDEKQEALRSIDSFHQKIDSIISALEQKEQNPFSTPFLEEDASSISVEPFQRISEFIKRHNQRTNDFGKQINQEKKELELHYIAGFIESYNELCSNIIDLEKQCSEFQTTIDGKETEIKELRDRLVSHYIPAQQINDDLEAFLGRSDIKLIATEAKEGYRIARNGETLENLNLSEGEKTALAIVYFLAKINEEGFDSKNSVIVIDDPVSSLDSNAIFQAFSFIKESIKEAGQIFILTHHFDFFRQVKNWFSHIKKPDKAEYFMTVCNMKTSSRNSSMVKLDNLLLNYESEYHFLFSVLYKLTKEQNGNLEKIYPIPNMARKFLESFLAFRVPLGLGVTNIYRRLKRIENFDEKKKERIRRFVETHSHPRYESGVQDFDMTLLGETSEILNDLMELVEKEDPKHYAFLVESITG